MGMTSTIQKAVMSGFKAAGDLVKTGTYVVQSGEGVRDVASGTTVYPQTSYPISMVVYAKFKQHEIDGNAVKSTDQKIIFPRQLLPATVEPKSEDTFIDDKGRTWEIKDEMSPPGEAVLILQARTTR